MSRRAAAFFLSLLCCSSKLAAEDAEVFLRHEQRRAAVWNWTWRGIFAAGIGLSAVQLAREDEKDLEIVHQVGIAKAGLALVNSFVYGLSIPAVGYDVDAALREAAENERRGRGIWPHASGFAINLGAALYLGIVHERWGWAAWQGLSGMAITEVRIFTQPYRAARGFAVAPTGKGLSLVFAF